MRTATIVPARYHPTDVRRFDGNPFIEALPPLPATRDTFLIQLSNYPDKPTDALRRKSEIVRMMEVNALTEIVYPFPDYEKPAIALASMLRETYIARNPLNAIDMQRRHALATSEKDGLPFPPDWRSSAKGHCIIAVSGMGKTTFADAFLLRYPQVITHTSYHGRRLTCQQITYVMLRVPHDATLKSLCLQFFSEIDRLLGTEYFRSANSVRNISPMVELMNRVATSVSLGLIVIDEVQHIRSASGKNSELMLNLFSEILERIGISLFLMATPALDTSLLTNVHNTRKSVSDGFSKLSPMSKNSPEWIDFTDTYWDHTYVKTKTRLTKSIRQAWYDASAGNTAFAVLSFLLTQRNAIGGVEIVDEAGFNRTLNTDMAILGPAIQALRSRKHAKMAEFDDLLFGSEYEFLMKQLQVDFPAPPISQEEFDDISNQERSTKPPHQTRPRVPRKAASSPMPPPEDPLKRAGKGRR
ncbi:MULTISPECIES: ATP-binding protein [Burkholderia cepacia complex]|uniref:ORC1/DEAH AAA+ ATPase domain-containing protein n=2 Tax=Burkholderia cepacia complex TaxID=87882 RepID=B1KCU5_BURO0|nr:MULTISPECIES: ATP-binding protein [Burkholderia cepacia complex]ACA96042.1 conserved hypothetical protein [Burkholderia orbicola MC0-3]MCA8085822.1 ATP-binding protein [Burkholderia cenocepacia]